MRPITLLGLNCLSFDSGSLYTRLYHYEFCPHRQSFFQALAYPCRAAAGQCYGPAGDDSGLVAVPRLVDGWLCGAGGPLRLTYFVERVLVAVVIAGSSLAGT